MSEVSVQIQEGLKVKVHTRKSIGGSFTGEIIYIGVHELWVLPDSEDIRKFLGGNGRYVIGKAHWRTSIEAI